MEWRRRETIKSSLREDTMARAGLFGRSCASIVGCTSGLTGLLTVAEFCSDAMCVYVHIYIYTRTIISI